MFFFRIRSLEYNFRNLYFKAFLRGSQCEKTMLQYDRYNLSQIKLISKNQFRHYNVQVERFFRGYSRNLKFIS